MLPGVKWKQKYFLALGGDTIRLSHGSEPTSSLDDEVVISYSYSSFLFLFLKELPLIFKELQGASDKFRHFTTRFCRIFVSLEIFSRPVKASENLYFLR